MKILVLVAHPDDEVIICGATIDKLIKNGHKIFVTYYTHNDQAYFNKETQIKRKERVVKEAGKSAKLLGYRINFLPFIDMQVESDKGAVMISTINEIRRIKPDIIFTHQNNDKHIDHRTIAEIVPEANFQSGCKLCGGSTQWSAKAVLQGEVNLEMTMPFVPEVLSEVSELNIQRKLDSFVCYTSVMDEHGTNATWLFDKLSYTARIRGAVAGIRFAEGFMINSYIPLHPQALELLSKLLRL